MFRFIVSQNTASRIEATGEGNRIHLSQEAADELKAANKGHWVKAREDKIHAKGKGLMTTYWLNGKHGFELPLPDLTKAASIEDHEFK